ncbi:ISL3 family transposase [Actinacidiphila glaucinigra]|uniref:Transposase n=1 Tax=Actinacidiphila glaucinigra TaxID=235986 RepID=A0A239NP32_9ACTN|nr:ISL3 family transposase [Actinacidiphila glaucinigra]SNT56138.1 Transposase [Actinacidiphila glaucinigra]
MLQQLFPHLSAVLVEQVRVEEETVLVVARTRDGTAVPCPDCGGLAWRVHSRYRRHLADAGFGGRRVVIDLRVRRLFCDSAHCARRTFAEQTAGLTVRYGRRTAVLTKIVQTIALALAGRAGARLADVLHIPISRTTLLNVVMAMPDPPRPALRVLGVDDFATRRGRRYGTVLVDLDSHRVVDLLPGRGKAPLVSWLADHPGIEMVCRDRAGAYAEAANVGAPQARQVADAWHLWDNLAHTVERTVITHRSCLTPPPPPQSEPTRTKEPPDPALNPDTGTEKWLVTRTRERYRAVQDLLAQGWTISAIGRELGLARHTARRYARCENPEALADRAIRTTRLDTWRPYLISRWNQGCTNASALFREIQAQGYPGRTPQAVRRLLRPLRDTAKAAPAPPPKPQDLTRWITRHPGRLRAEEEQQLEDVLSRCPELARLSTHVHAFARMICDRTGTDLPAWIRAVHADDLPQLHAFADGLDRDWDAVLAGLTLPWSSGPVEGHVNRIKMLKRQMYGRASLPLLRKRVLLA